MVLLLSSDVLERSRAVARRAGRSRPWIGATFVLGVTFVIGQVLAWRQLQSSGLNFSATPYASFFFLLTAAHAIHVAGGILGLGVATAWPHGGFRRTPLVLVLR